MLQTTGLGTKSVCVGGGEAWEKMVASASLLACPQGPLVCPLPTWGHLTLNSFIEADLNTDPVGPAWAIQLSTDAHALTIAAKGAVNQN